jgi:large subunit ribosomal protein L28
MSTKDAFLAYLAALCYYVLVDFARFRIWKPKETYQLKCDICSKIPMYGSNVSHSKRHTNRRWLANIHPATVLVDGKKKQINVCTRCLRNQNKATV